MNDEIKILTGGANRIEKVIDIANDLNEAFKDTGISSVNEIDEEIQGVINDHFWEMIQVQIRTK